MNSSYVGINVLFRFIQRKPRLLFAALTAFVIVLNGLALSSLLSTGYANDDALNSSISGYLAYTNTSLFDFTWSNFSTWVTNEGRFFPFAFYVYALFSLVTSLWWYKLGSLLMTLLAFWTFSKLVERLTHSRMLGLLILLMPSLIVQFRGTIDPVLSFHYLLPLCLVYVSGSLWAFLVWLDSNRRSALISSAVLFVIALLTYEINIAYVVLFPLFSFYRRRSWRRAALDSVPAIGIAIAVLCLSLFLRSRAAVEIDPRYTVTFSPFTYIPAVLGHVLASFPLSYYLFNLVALGSFGIKAMAREIVMNTPWWMIVNCTVSGGMFGLLAYRTKNLPIPKLLVTGGLLLFLPFLLISLSVKHQAYPLGIGYLPVLLGYAGAILVLLAVGLGLLGMLKKRGQRIGASVAGALCFVLVLVLNFHANGFVVRNQNQYWRYPRSLLETALDRGLLDGVSANSTIVMAGSAPWDNEFVLMMHGKVRVFVIKPGDRPGDEKAFQNQVGAGKVYYLRYAAQGPDAGFAFLGHVTSVDANYWVSKEPASAEVGVDFGHVFYYEAGAITEAFLSREAPVDAESLIQEMAFGVAVPSPNLVSGDTSALFQDEPQTSLPDLLAKERWSDLLGTDSSPNQPQAEGGSLTVECLIPPSAASLVKSSPLNTEFISEKKFGLRLVAARDGRDEYELRFGNLRGPVASVRFGLKPDVWHYVVVSSVSSKQTIWVDGVERRTVDEVPKGVALAFGNSLRVSPAESLMVEVPFVRWRPVSMTSSMVATESDHLLSASLPSER